MRFFLFAWIIYSLLMWDVGHSTIATPLNGGEGPPTQRIQGSSFSPFSTLFFQPTLSRFTVQIYFLSTPVGSNKVCFLHRVSMTIPDCSPFLPAQQGSQPAKTGHPQAHHLRIALSLPSTRTLTLVLSSTRCSAPPNGHSLCIGETTMATIVAFTSRGTVIHYPPFSPTP